MGVFFVLLANAGLLALPRIMRRQSSSPQEQAQAIPRSFARMATATVASLLFVFVVARGLSWSR